MFDIPSGRINVFPVVHQTRMISRHLCAVENAHGNRGPGQIADLVSSFDRVVDVFLKKYCFITRPVNGQRSGNGGHEQRHCSQAVLRFFRKKHGVPEFHGLAGMDNGEKAKAACQKGKTVKMRVKMRVKVISAGGLFHQFWGSV